MRMRLTLPTKTALLSTLLVLALVGTIGVWQYRGLSDQYVNLVRTQEQGFAQLAADDLDYKLENHLDALIREAKRADTATFRQPEAQQRFLDQTDLRAKFDGIALVGLDGTVIVNDPPNPRVVNIADREYFRRARDNGYPVISAPLQARILGQPGIVMIAPVKDETAATVGLLAGGLALDKPNVLGDLALARFGENGYYVIETAGPNPVYVVHPDPRRVLQPAPHQPDTLTGDLTASAPIPTTGWVLRVVLPAEAAYAPLARARRQLLQQMGLLGLVCSVLVWAGTVLLMRPLTRLHGAIRTLRQTPDRAVALDVHTRDERGDLAREFDALMTELRDRRTELAAITDASPTGLFRCDTQGDMVYVNDAYLAIYGLTRADAPRAWLGLVKEKSREQVWHEWQALAAGDQPFHGTRWIRRRDGEDVLVSLHMRPILGEGGVVGQVGTVSDITERTRAEQAQRTLTTILEATTDYVVQASPGGRITYLNAAARRVTGIAPDAPIEHLTMADLNPPHMLKRLQREIVPTVMTEGVWVGESEVWAEGRVLFPVSHMVLAHRDKNGSIERFSGIMRDISAAKAAERALLESEARLRTVADALPMRVAYIDAAQRYQFVNLAYDGEFGMPREAIPGRTMAELYEPARYRAIEPHVRAVLAGERVRFESELATAIDYTCHETNFIPQWDVDGRSVIGFHAVTLDITRQKREERRLSQLASQDPLTGLGNRTAFEARLEEAMESARAPQGTPIALMYVDLDHFKQVNDRWGHLGGDALLRGVAARLSHATRNTDFVARLGGDEFVVILCALRDTADAARIAQKIVNALHEPFALEEALTITVTASIGVACYEGGDLGREELVRKADEMLYQAKGAGRDNFRMAGALEQAS